MTKIAASKSYNAKNRHFQRASDDPDQLIQVFMNSAKLGQFLLSIAVAEDFFMKAPIGSMKWLSVVVITVVLNLIACSNASFEATDTTATKTPQPDNPNSPFNPPNSGDPFACTNNNTVACDTDDSGFKPYLPPLNFTPPFCEVTPTSPKCMTNNYRNATQNPIDGVHVWLVVDSSESFDDERLAVANAVTSGFLSSLQRQVPVTISVIVGHAPTSSYAGFRSSAPAVNPEVFYRHSSEPISIRLLPTMSSAQFQTARNQLLSKVGASMQESPISLAKRNRGSVDGMSWELAGPHSGSDELGLRNLFDAMSRTSIPANNAFVVLFLSDENDVCTPFVDGSRYVYSHRDEEEMFYRYCSGINVDSVFSRIVQFVGSRPFVLGALVYTGQAPIPSGIQHSVGKGYTNVVARAGRSGVMVDLASRNVIGLQTVADRLVSGAATVTNESVGLHNQFPIFDQNKQRLNLSQVATFNLGGSERFNMQVYVDGIQVGYTLDTMNSLIRPSRLGVNVEIRFCIK